MITQIINIIYSFAFEPENDPVIIAHFHRPEAFHISQQRMKSVPRNLHLKGVSTGIKPGEY